MPNSEPDHARSISDFESILPREHVSALRDAMNSQTLTPSVASEVLGDAAVELLGLGQKLAGSELDKILEAQKRAVAFREWVAHQLPGFLEREDVAGLFTSSDSEDSAAESDETTIPFQQISRVGALPFYLPYEGALIPLLKLQFHSNDSLEANLLLRLENAMFVAYAIIKGASDSLEVNRPFAAKQLVMLDDMEDIERHLSRTVEAANEALKLVREITARQAPP